MQKFLIVAQFVLAELKNFCVKSSYERFKTFVTKVLKLMVCQGSKLLR